ACRGRGGRRVGAREIGVHLPRRLEGVQEVGPQLLVRHRPLDVRLDGVRRVVDLVSRLGHQQSILSRSSWAACSPGSGRQTADPPCYRNPRRMRRGRGRRLPTAPRRPRPPLRPPARGGGPPPPPPPPPRPGG